MAPHGLLGATFVCARIIQLCSLVAIIGLTANFIAEIVSNGATPPAIFIGTITVLHHNHPLPRQHPALPSISHTRHSPPHRRDRGVSHHRKAAILSAMQQAKQRRFKRIIGVYVRDASEQLFGGFEWRDSELHSLDWGESLRARALETEEGGGCGEVGWVDDARYADFDDAEDDEDDGANNAADGDDNTDAFNPPTPLRP
ncbi:hypothetical protein AnigIFM50267_003223 [Aspergillus niger]|nr:hypothetical protein AnigIFM50267_003223 [Aspergillus niger]GLA17969.1 hypothetical protein AnigIFM62618_005122 [Aspergillus niger]